MKAIINREQALSTLDGVLMPTSKLMSLVIKHLKADTAKLVVDTPTTLMYELQDSQAEQTREQMAQAKIAREIEVTRTVMKGIADDLKELAYILSPSVKEHMEADLARLRNELAQLTKN